MLIVAIIIAAVSAAYLWGLPLFTKSGDVTRLRYVQDTLDRVGADILAIAREGGQRTVEIRIDEGWIILDRDETGSYVISYLTSSPVSFFPPTKTPVTDWNSPYQERVTELNFTTPVTGPISCANTRAVNQTVDNTAYSFYLCDPTGEPVEYTCMYKEPLGNPPTSECMTPGSPITPDFRLDYIGPTGDFATLVDGMETAVGLLGQDKPGVVLGQAKKLGNRFDTTLTLKMRRIFDPTKNELMEIELTPKRGGAVRSRGTFAMTFRNAGERVEVRDGTLFRIATIEIELK